MALPTVAVRCGAHEFAQFRSRLDAALANKRRSGIRLEFEPPAASRAATTTTTLADAAHRYGFCYASGSLLHSVRVRGSVNSNAGSDNSLVAVALRAAAGLFWLPTDVKAALAPPPRANVGKHERGYYRYVSEALDQDSIEAYQLGPEFVSAHPHRGDVPVDGPLVAPGSPSPLELRAAYLDSIEMPLAMRNVGRTGNIWPHAALASTSSRQAARHAAVPAALSPTDAALCADEFHDIFVAYFLACQLTAHSMLSSISAELGGGSFAAAHARCDSVMELKRYPPLRLGADQTRLVAHADLSSLTLLAQDAEGGLQVLRSAHCGRGVDGDGDDGVHGDSEWIDAPARSDAVLVNTGDFLVRFEYFHFSYFNLRMLFHRFVFYIIARVLQQDWTCGHLRSTLHRVKARDGRYANERHSIVHFCTPDWDARIQPQRVRAGGARDAHGGDSAVLPPVASNDDQWATESYLAGDRMPF